MEAQQILQILSRWVHLIAVIVLVGGATFLRFVLIPSAKSLGDAEHAALRGEVVRHWRRFVHPLVALILLSGIYNIVVRFQSGMPVATWHMLLTVKILLALFVLFMASALVGRSTALQPVRDKAEIWLAINLALAAVIVLLSGILKNLPAKTPQG